ncbi:hypothetical protein [Planococcus donghaensis]|uniref:Uncharacterized protein n=1 Tax=Planococcus donghaensis TaxID=414778 RepID=A0A1C7EHS1_9BACL|nr:hypothetical protein [Planococcus donghaensis]ANU23369.1 hypothetical protein BCM40_08280 [Planococcus donghaensis]
MLSVLVELIGGLFGGVGYSDTLNTRKIDRNIERLNECDWFKKVYEDKKYHRLFFVNKRVRHYLQSTVRIRRIIRSDKAQKKLLLLLDKEIKSVLPSTKNKDAN